MVDLYYKLASAIATQEGYFVFGTRPGNLHNPGDLRLAPWLQHPVIENGYWHAESNSQGIAGLYHQIALDIARGYTLRQLINSWAPNGDGANAPGTYLANVLQWTGITNPDQPLQELVEIRKAN